MQLGELLAAPGKKLLMAVIDEAFDRFGQRRQRRLAVAGDGEIDILPAAEILIIGLEVEIAHAERDDFSVRLRAWPRLPHDAVGKMRQRAPQVVHLEGEDDVGLADQASAETLVERMA